MTTADVSVRPARSSDLRTVAAVQVEAYRSGYEPILPARVLAALRLDDVADSWSASLAEPPTRFHRLLVALAADEPVGLAATGVCEDPDVTGAAELLTLLVRPGSRHGGHGSRLLAACVDGWRADGRDQAVCWVFEGDRVLQDWLSGAGFGVDGATRQVEVGDRPLAQVRMHTVL